MILLSADTLKAEIMATVSMLEDGDLTGALRQLRAMFTSCELQQELQSHALETVERALENSKKHLKAVEDQHE